MQNQNIDKQNLKPNNNISSLSSEPIVKQNKEKRGKKVAVIGCGYVGKTVASYWYQQGYIVTGTTTRENKISELKNIAHNPVVMIGDNLKGVEKVIETQETILVSIAPISDRQVDAEVYAQTYIPTAKNLVTVLNNNSTVKQVIYLSSGSVYGDKKGEWVDETSSLDTNSDYSKVLVEAENIILGLNKEDIKVCLLRLGGIYGPGRELDKRIGRIAGKTLPGNGESRVSWIHLEDIVQGIEFVHEKGCHGIYNLVNDLKLSSKELCDLICERQQLDRVSWDTNKPAFSTLNAQVDNSKIKKEGYQFIYADTII
ncbi:MAG: SDR family oxidoreductase [Okeania sp. SIO3I5]|uniref:SDR family oxidoreductase n=1 Tax=Okeania sp. SIO3I5 TaxID=2607805 RepID=UPI0013B7C47C|nr:SDR family oxidoreductase [Okeania sp. SIO3I5]NEQ39030.1 SDR family oxidoreductase [Okeania sp. SIO3I5]